MDSQETLPENDTPVWPELSADVTVARSVARAITLDTQKASLDGRVIELSSQVQSVNARLIELENAAGDQARNVNVDELSSLVAALRSQIDRTNANLDDLARNAFTLSTGQVDDTPTLDDRVPGLADRLSTVEDARLRDTEQLSGLMSYLETAFVRLDDLSAQVETVREHASDPEPLGREISELGSSVDSLRLHVGTTEESLRAEFERIEDRIRRQVSTVEENLAEQVAQASDQLANRQSEFEARLADQESNHISDSRLDDHESFVAGRIAEVDSRLTDIDARLAQRIGDADANMANARAGLDEARSSLADAP